MDLPIKAHEEVVGGPTVWSTLREPKPACPDLAKQQNAIKQRLYGTWGVVTEAGQVGQDGLRSGLRTDHIWCIVGPTAQVGGLYWTGKAHWDNEEHQGLT